MASKGQDKHVLKTHTAKNIVISSNFLVWKFYGKAQFPHSFGEIALDEITVFLVVLVVTVKLVYHSSNRAQVI